MCFFYFGILIFASVSPDFPGRTNRGESHLGAAIRETEEVTGLKYEYDFEKVDGFKTVIYVTDSQRQDKKVTFWLGQLVNNYAVIKISQKYQDAKWLPVEEACDLVVANKNKQLLRDADEFLSSHVDHSTSVQMEQGANAQRKGRKQAGILSRLPKPECCRSM